MARNNYTADVALTTPKVKLLFPHLHEPDAAFDQNVYKVDFLLDPDDHAHKAFLGALHDIFDDAMEDLKGKRKTLKIDTATKPWKDDVDQETGEPTGLIRVVAKLDADKGKPGVFDSKAQPIAPVPEVGNGTIAKVAVGAYGWDIGSKSGLRLKLKGVQIFDLKGGGSASCGFQAEEEGYVAAGGDFEDEEALGINGGGGDF